ncbi:MAG: PAS domain S-box protein, partial [Bacteroidales bacterium]|nr:PAS domain S-box protein [Bacteroidales bacterium]
NYVKVAVDITEHKKAEKKLKKSEEKLRNILDNSTNLFYSHTSENINIYQSPQVKKILGYETEDVMIKWRGLVSDNPVNKIGFEHTEKAIRTGKPQPTYELELVHKTGRKVWVEVREAPVVEKGKAKTIVGALTDITKRKRAEHIRQALYNISNAATTSSNLNELIKLIHKQLGYLIDTTNFYIALYDEKSDSINLPYIADQGEKLTSFPAGKTLTAYVIKTKKPLLATAHVINNLEESGEIELIGKLSRIWLGVPLKVEGKVIGVLVVQSYDDEDAYKQSDLELLEFVSDQISVSIGRKKAEEDIKSALGKAKESDRLKSVFLGTMSHEFRTPLNTVIGFSEIIDKDTPKEEVLDFVETINNSGKHLLGLVEDIFDISLIETGEIKILKEDFLIGAFMRNLQNFLKSEQGQADKKNIEISYKAPKDDKNIMAFTDGRRLNQILINLLKNALKFTNKGYIEYGYAPEIMDDQSCLKFYVKDTGIGISKDKQKYIFEIFRQGDDTYTRRYEGIGIGLSVSKKLTELLGGKMWLESEIGKGSCFYFTLPFVG